MKRCSGGKIAGRNYRSFPQDMPRSLVPTPLTPSSFAPYGDVLEAGPWIAPQLINEGNTQRFHNLAELTLDDSGGKPGISLFRSRPLQHPLTLKTMERHPLSSQAFYPLSGRPFLVAVAPAGELNPAAISVFLASPTQGVNYHPGTWHHYSLALEQESDFLVIDRIAEDDNCDERQLDSSDWIHIDLTGLGIK